MYCAIINDEENSENYPVSLRIFPHKMRAVDNRRHVTSVPGTITNCDTP